MQQHVGAPCKPLVKVGDLVQVGQKIGDSDAFVSAPIHASISGKVSAVTKVALPGGQMVDAVGDRIRWPDDRFPRGQAPCCELTGGFYSGLFMNRAWLALAVRDSRACKAQCAKGQAS